MPKKHIHISVDIEASGPAPPRYSMLSLGACVVGNREQQFYRELMPTTMDYIRDAIAVPAPVFDCTIDLSEAEQYNPKSDHFSPLLVLERLAKYGTHPFVAMRDFADWITDISQDAEPQFWADTAGFDWMFICSAFSVWDVKNPFGFTSYDIDSFYRGAKKDFSINLRSLGLVDRRKRPHHALDDAIFQAEIIEAVFEREGVENTGIAA